MRRLVFALCSLGALAGPTVALTEAHSTPSATPIVRAGVDLRANRQRIDGFGSSERVWSDPHLADAPRVTVPATAQAQIMTLLYRTVGLTRVRNVLDQGVQKEPAGPFEFSGKLADDHIAFVKQARRYGLRTFFPGPVFLEPWMTESDPGATLDWAMAMLRHWRSLGLEPRLYAPLNEPHVAGDFDPAWMREVVIGLGRALKAEGFDTKLVVPDDENPVDAYRRAAAVLANPEARGYVGALAYHVYRWNSWSLDDLARMRALAARYRVPLWMTEYSSASYDGWDASLDWASKMHVLLTTGGVSAVDFLWGFFGEKYATDALVSIRFEDGRYRAHRLTPIGAIMGQYARFVRPGSVRVEATSSTDQLRVTAYNNGRRLVVVATNLGSTARALRVTVKGGALRGAVEQVRSSANERLRSLSPLRSRTDGFSARLAPRSVTTFAVER